MSREESLRNFCEALSTEDVFDAEDVAMCRNELEAAAAGGATEFNSVLEALRRYVPARRRRIEELNKRLNLSTHFPAMMRLFARKDAKLAMLLERREAEAAGGV